MHPVWLLNFFRYMACMVLWSLIVVSVQAGETNGQSAEALNPDWELVSDRDGIEVYMRHGEGSRLKTFRGVTRIRLEDEYALVAVLNDYGTLPEWLHFVDGAEEISRSGPLERNLRFTTRLPWPLQDREAVLRADVVQKLDGEEDSVMVHLSNAPGLIPDNDRYIRFPEAQGVFGARRLGNNRVEIIYEMVLDPGGYIPAWLANVILRQTPHYSLTRLRRVVRRPEYQNQYFDYVDLLGPGRPDDAQPLRPNPLADDNGKDTDRAR